MQANLGKQAGFNLLGFVFAGVLAQVLFQSTAAGVISLIEDREKDFSQAIFIAPISRYSIVIGKILGETMVSLVQGTGVVVFGLIIGVRLTIPLIIMLLPAVLAASLLGGAFGVLVLANLGTQRRANQVFPLILFPQLLLAGVFNPIKNLPPILFVLSRIAPMTYAVDLMRGLFYIGRPEATSVVLHHPLINALIILILFAIFLIIGTYFFVRNERSR